jgi:GTPase SAR1 family protein
MGARGVGKSTVIKRAFKSWGLSGPLVLAEANGQGKGVSLHFQSVAPFQTSLLTISSSSHIVSSYSAQVETGHAPRIRSVSIEVLEIDIHVLFPTEGDLIWPKSLPKIDGAMLCYSALDATSLGGVKEVLSESCPVFGFEDRVDQLRPTFSDTFCLNLPTIVIACKSDPGVVLAIDATAGNEIGSPFGVGLVEVTTLAHAGRQKVKLSFGWMLRAISREMSA